MSTKTIAVDSRVYDKLAAEKRDGESFSRTIDRLIEEVGAAHTGRDIIRGLAGLPVLDDKDAEVMLAVVAENRNGEDWDEHDLR
jgi:predicted CopG family antitoxin